jgi:HK97 family phage major capsid protein
MLHQRDLLAAGNGSGSEHLVDGIAVRPLELPLTGSRIGAAGARFLTGATRPVRIPAVGVSPTLTWLQNESDSLTPDSATELTAHGASFNTAGLSVKSSRQLMLQAPVESILNQLLIQIGNDTIDTGAINGSGANGEPLGALEHPDVPSVTAATGNLPALGEMEEASVSAGANDANLTWLAAPNVRHLFRSRLITGGAVPIWPESTLLGHRTVTTPKMPAGSLLVGDFSNMLIVLYGRGLEVLADPFSDFKSGVVCFQVRLQMSVVLPYPASFRKAEVT